MGQGTRVSSSVGQSYVSTIGDAHPPVVPGGDGDGDGDGDGVGGGVLPLQSTRTHVRRVRPVGAHAAAAAAAGGGRR